MNVSTYNGWTNYETWVAKLWMDNDESSYRYWQEVADDCLENSSKDKLFTREENAKAKLADRLKGVHTEQMPELNASVWSDLLSAAMSEINWYEIAGSLIEDAVERSA